MQSLYIKRWQEVKETIRRHSDKHDDASDDDVSLSGEFDVPGTGNEQHMREADAELQRLRYSQNSHEDNIAIDRSSTQKTPEAQSNLATNGKPDTSQESPTSGDDVKPTGINSTSDMSTGQSQMKGMDGSSVSETVTSQADGGGAGTSGIASGNRQSAPGGLGQPGIYEEGLPPPGQARRPSIAPDEPLYTISESD